MCVFLTRRFKIAERTLYGENPDWTNEIDWIRWFSLKFIFCDTSIVHAIPFQAFFLFVLEIRWRFSIPNRRCSVSLAETLKKEFSWYRHRFGHICSRHKCKCTPTALAIFHFFFLSFCLFLYRSALQIGNNHARKHKGMEFSFPLLF